MSVHQRDDGRWIVMYKIDGKSKKKSFGRGLAAEQNARQFNESLSLRQWKRRTAPPQSVQFSELVNEYGQAKANEWPAESVDNWSWKMSGVILPALGHLQVMQMTEKHLVSYVKNRLQVVKATTVHRDLSDIQAVLNWGADKKFIAYNPVAGFTKPKRDDAIIPYPKKHELMGLIDHAATHLVKALLLSFYTGLRPGKRELFALTWDDVDFEGRTIMVRSAVKGGLRYREVPLHKDLEDLLLWWRETDDCKYIVNYRGKKIGSIKKAFSGAKKRAGITRRLRPYDLRHAFASMVLKNREDLKATSELLGHTRVDTTMRLYQQTDTQMHRDAVDSLPPIF